MYYEADPYTGFRLKAHGVGTSETGVSANANSLGLRDREISLAKIFRILVN
jgi:hypothetical protein